MKLEEKVHKKTKKIGSHPAGVRGLKQRALVLEGPGSESHPAGVRGLKHQIMGRLLCHNRRRTPQGCVD